MKGIYPGISTVNSMQIRAQRPQSIYNSYFILQIVTLVGWTLAAVIGMGLVYGPHKSALPGATKWTEAENILYGTFDRALWGLVLAWVTYACHYHAGGIYTHDFYLIFYLFHGYFCVIYQDSDNISRFLYKSSTVCRSEMYYRIRHFF